MTQGKKFAEISLYAFPIALLMFFCQGDVDEPLRFLWRL